MSSFEQTMAAGRARYQDVLDALVAAGLPAFFTQTGGMNAALEVRLEDGQTLLVTDAEDSLAWDRRDHRGWGVGLYVEGSEYDSGPSAFTKDEDGSLPALMLLVQRLLRGVLADRPG